MIDIVEELKTWLKGLEIVKLAKACKAFWDDVKIWLQVPLNQRDIENCHQLALTAHGWARRTERFPEEEIDLYRSRVLKAHQNIKRAGLIKGLEEILTEFQVPEFSILERYPQVDPDVVTIEMPQGGITDDQDLLLKIFQEYGMTCRRYAQAVSEVIQIRMPSAELEHNQDFDIVVPNQTFFAEETINMNIPAGMFAHDQQTEIASV
jgi:hypothetical protein